MSKIEAGLYRTHAPLPGYEAQVPRDALVYVGRKPGAEELFVVRPQHNRNNRWYWHDPVLPLADTDWAERLKRLPSEGFYTLPEAMTFSDGGRWLENAIVQLGYNEQGQGILFIAEARDDDSINALRFSSRGLVIDDDLLPRLRWAPILPVTAEAVVSPGPVAPNLN